jgi:hypothetical protein
MRKKVDSRIRTLVENCVKLRQRAMFVIIGDKGRDQVVNLHYMLSKASVKARPSVLWCYKKDLALSRWAGNCCCCCCCCCWAAWHAVAELPSRDKAIDWCYHSSVLHQ